VVLGQLTHPLKVGAEVALQPAEADVGGDLDHPTAALGHGPTEGHHLIRSGEGAGNGLAIEGPVQHDPRGAEPESPGLHRFGHDGGHGLDLGRGRIFVAGPSFTHYVGADRTVGYVGGNVHDPGHGFQGIEVLREGLPTPLNAFGQGRAGDVLHPFHELDQPVVPVGLDRGETDPAVAHDRGGHPVQRRWRELGVPGGLAVVVGVDVDKTGGDDQPGGVDLTSTGADFIRFDDGADGVAVDGDIGAAGSGPGAIDDGSTPDHQVMHGRLLVRRPLPVAGRPVM